MIPETTTIRTQSRENGLQFLLPIAFSLLLSRLVITLPNEPGSTELLALCYASSACFSAVLFLPVGPTRCMATLISLGRNCAFVVGLFAVAVLLDPQTRTLGGQVLPLAIMLFLLMLATFTLVIALRAHERSARPVVFTILAVLFAAPLWLGPLAEQTGNDLALTNMIVGASPLSALAATLDADYLRSSWFYQHSAIGSMRYAYFSWSSYALFFATVILSVVIGVAGFKYSPFNALLLKRVDTQ